MLVLFTDGLIETPRPPRSVLTIDQLKDLLNKEEDGKTARELCQAAVSRLFSEPTTKAEDDITLVVAKHTAGKPKPFVDYAI